MFCTLSVPHQEYRGGGSPPTNTFLWAKLKVSVFLNGQFRGLFFLRKIFVFSFCFEKKYISPRKRELVFFEKIFVYFPQKFLFFLSLFFVFFGHFFLLFFFLVRILRGFWPIQKKSKKMSEKNKKKWQKKTKCFGKNKQSSHLRGEIDFFKNKNEKQNIFLKKKKFLNCPF